MSSFWDSFKAVPRIAPQAAPTGECLFSLVIPARKAGHSLEETVEHAHRFFQKRYGPRFEIILVPNPAPGDSSDHSVEISERLADRFSEVKVRPHFAPQGKGAALRTGVFSARGEWICFTDADLPYDLEFFDQAIEKLRHGTDFVTGNRRLPNSDFDIPVGLLKLAYARHRLGLGFNRVVRFLLPVSSTDTQAGIKAMSRRLAWAAFEQQTCPGFFFDLEIFLTARALGFRHAELPVVLYLNSEKSTVRVLRESILAGFWLLRITWQNRLGLYGRVKS